MGLFNENGIFKKLFHPDITYNNQYPSFINTIDKMTKDNSSAKKKYEMYLDYTRVNYERKLAYKDFENMDQDILGAALDLWADDATQFNLSDGESFYIECENQEIKELLEDLFFKQLNIEENLYTIARTTAKYGDYFARVIGEDQVGIKYLDFSLHPSRIQRIDYQGTVNKFIIDEQIQCNPWDIVHFKYPGGEQFSTDLQAYGAMSKAELNDTENPYTYGKSLLDKARKTWKQLQLTEDSIILSRLSRAIKRNVFSVNTAGLSEIAGWDLVDKVANLLKKNKILNSGTGMESNTGLLNPEEDIVLPVSGEKGQITIQEIGGDVDIQHLADIEYLTSKLFADIKTPKAYLGFEESLNGRNTLRMLDVRYARSIKNLQRVLTIGLERIAHIHLSLLGKDPFGVDFVIRLPYISTIEEVEKAETMEAKANAVQQLLNVISAIDSESEIVDKEALIKYAFKEMNISETQINKLLKRDSK